jgi:hypothetical protein
MNVELNRIETAFVKGKKRKKRKREKRKKKKKRD